jgi:hypothetical protein
VLFRSGAHVRWRVAFDDATSPWEPLLQIWERGAWPVALPDAMLVYVPVRHEGQVIADPADPAARLPIAYLPYELGFAVGDVFDRSGLDALPTGLMYELHQTAPVSVTVGPLPPPELP